MIGLAVIAGLLLLALVLVAGFNWRRDGALLEHANRVIAENDEEGLPPQSLEDALLRLEKLVQGDDDRDLDLRRYDAAFADLSTGTIIADADGQVVLRNRSAQPYATGRHGDALVEDVIQARLQDALRGEHTDEELRLHGPPERVLLVVGSPIVESGELIGAVILIDDVSEQQRLDSVRRDFVANVSHELRTPVGALSLLAETLEGETDPGVIANFLGRIQGETGRLSRLIEDLLDLSRIEAGLSETVGEVDMGSVVHEAFGAMRSAAEHKAVELELVIDDEVPSVMGDRAQLLSAVTNLLGNGVKYTDAGGSVKGRLVAHGAELAIVVEDTGIGIPQKDVNRVFERFYRVDASRGSSTGGTGLGLSIVRHVAVNHGGRVEVVSQEGVGSTFSMILPTRDGDPLTNAQHSVTPSATGDFDE